MAYKLVNLISSPIGFECMHEYILDKEDDVKSLPPCNTGSSALVIESGNVYIVNTSGEWTLFGKER